MNKEQPRGGDANPNATEPLPPAAPPLPPAQASSPVPEGAPSRANALTAHRPTPRERYLRARRQRETLLFTWVGAAAIVLLIPAILIGFGIIPFPFLSSFHKPVEIARSGDIPCPTGEKNAVPLQRIQTTVLNGTSQAGLAREVSDKLKAAGVPIKHMGNYSKGPYEGAALIVAGPTGVNSAYTIAHAFKDFEIVMDTRPRADVTVIVGDGYEDVLDAASLKQTATGTLSPLPHCLVVGGL